jgi:hypothetical protein
MQGILTFHVRCLFDGLTRRFDTWGGITRDERYTMDLSEIDRFKAEPAS